MKIPAFKPLLSLVFLSFFSQNAAPARADEITVSAAASLRDVLGALGADFSRGGTIVRFNFGSSGTLQKQIEAGAPTDLFIAASRQNIVSLGEKGEIEGATRRVLARGDLVLIAPRDSKLRGWNDLSGAAVSSLALGGPGVPAGDYARQTLDFLHLSPLLRPKMVLARDVRAALNLVASGNADAGIVYRTDALNSKAVRIVALAPPQSHAEIVYPMAVVSGAPNRSGALRFWRFLQSQKARATLKKSGFR